MVDFPNPFRLNRGTRAKILASTFVPDAGAILTDSLGNQYIGDGATQEKNLPRLSRRIEVVGNATSLAALRAATDTQLAGFVKTSSYSSAGDGGGGLWRWDGADTTTTDDGVMVIAPTTGSGRWKRIYEDRANARWWGMRTGSSDNTQALQNACTWMGANPQSGSSQTGGILFIPFGKYKFLFVDGASGLSTISITGNNILIEGEGNGATLLSATGATPNDYFLTWTNATARGTGGGLRKLAISGNADATTSLRWGVFLDTWHDWKMEQVEAWNAFQGLLDAVNTKQATAEGELITLKHIGTKNTSGSGPASQFGVRFRGSNMVGAALGSWSDIRIDTLLARNVWDTGLWWDSVSRSSAVQIGTANSSAVPAALNSSGVDLSGCKRSMRIGNSLAFDIGRNYIEGVYLESHYGPETPATNAAVEIDATSTGRCYENKIVNVRVSSPTTGKDAGDTPAYVRVKNTSATPYMTDGNTVEMRGDSAGFPRVLIEANVGRTFIIADPQKGWERLITDAGQETYLNGVKLGSGYPANQFGVAGGVAVGGTYQDSASGRLFLGGRGGEAVRVPRGADIVQSAGAQKIGAMSTPAAPRCGTNSSVTSTTWTYYVVAIDAAGNKSIPSAAGTVGGPASLTSGVPNYLTWDDTPGAVAWDVLRGDTSHSVALAVTSNFLVDGGLSTSAYTAATANPGADLVVAGHIMSGGGTPTIDATFNGIDPTWCSVYAGTDDDCTIRIAVPVGATGMASGQQVRIKYSKAYATAPAKSAQRGDSGATTNIYCSRADWTTTTFIITSSAALVANATYYLRCS